MFHQRITKNNDIFTKVIKLSQICSEECKHEVLKVLCVDIKGIIKMFLYIIFILRY